MELGGIEMIHVDCGWTHHHRGQTVTTCVRQCLDTCLPMLTHLLRRIVVSHDNDHDDKGNVYLLNTWWWHVWYLDRWILFCPFPRSISWPTSTWNHCSNWTFFVNIFIPRNLFLKLPFQLTFIRSCVTRSLFFSNNQTFSSFLQLYVIDVGPNWTDLSVQKYHGRVLGNPQWGCVEQMLLVVAVSETRVGHRGMISAEANGTSTSCIRDEGGS